MDLKEFLEQGQKSFLPNLSIDLVIIAYEQGYLRCLLLKIGEKWLLPGGYIGREEPVGQAAQRILRDRTNLEDSHLRFLSVFGKADRRFANDFKASFEQNGMLWAPGYWVNDRFVSLTYYSLVNIKEVAPSVKNFDEDFAWFDLHELPEMWLDHADIVAHAGEQLKTDIRSELVSHNLLPEPFTMPELHQLHQTILDEKIDRSRFQKKMLSSGHFERLPRRRKDAPGRNPYQYRVKS